MKKKLLVTFSGGETSAFMAQWLNKYMSNQYEMLFVFANTGVESNETLEFVNKCSKHFNINITWIEASVFYNQRKSTGFKIVDYNTATRNKDWIDNRNTPFEQVVMKYGIPNHSRLHCTRELKMNPIKNFVKSVWGKESYYTALGIRVDEFDRINKNYKKNKLLYPLIEMKPMTKKHINFYWSQQNFRLNLKGYQGNCGACYKKSKNKLLQIAKEDKNYFDFFDYLENKYGNTKGIIPNKINGKLEKMPNINYKNVFFRNFQSAKDIIEESKSFSKSIKDDSLDIESCDIYSSCGDY